MPNNPINTQTNPLEKLNKRELRFVFFYVDTFNARQAAVAAGYTEKTAIAGGARLLARQRVRDAILYRQQLADSVEGITKEAIQKDLHKIATADPGDLYDFEEVPICNDDGSQAYDSKGNALTRYQPRLRSLNEMTPTERKNISEIQFHRDGTIKTLKFHSKLKAYDMLLKSKGGYVNLHQHEHRHEHSVDRLRRAKLQAEKEAKQARQSKLVDVTPSKTE